MKIFISYAHDDLGVVTPIVELLRHAGNDPWFDHQLLPGQHWKSELLKKISECDAFIYMLTPLSVASKWCQREFDEATRLKKPIVPILLNRETLLPKIISVYQYVDFTGGADR